MSEGPWLGSASPVAVRHAIPSGGRPASILSPGFDLTLRPMRYSAFYEMFRNAIKNTWTVEEIDFSDDLVDLHRKLLPAEKHLINAYGAWVSKKNYGKEYMGIERSTFLVDGSGTLKHAWRSVKVNGHAEAVLEEARKLG